MSDSNFSVNADAMTPAVDGLSRLGDRLSQITQHLESTLDGLGTPWGDDKNGHNFFQQYGKSRDQTLSGMSSMVDAVHGVSKGIHTMIKGYNNINDSAKERARNLQTTGGGGDGSGGGSYTRDQTPLQPERAVMRSRMPAERLQRANLPEGKLLPEETLRQRDGEPAQPLLPRETSMGRLLPAERDVPAGDFVPDDAPSTEGRVEPLEYSALQPAIPAERPLAFERVRDSIPAVPTGFAELEPERYLSRRDPESPEQ